MAAARLACALVVSNPGATLASRSGKTLVECRYELGKQATHQRPQSREAGAQEADGDLGGGPYRWDSIVPCDILGDDQIPKPDDRDGAREEAERENAHQYQLLRPVDVQLVEGR